MLGYIWRMKAKLAVKMLVLAVFSLATVLFAGCKTPPAVDWNSRVGICTFDQAVAELGSPDKQSRLSDGRIALQWITLHGDNGFFGGGAASAGGFGMAAGQPLMQTYKDHVLELTFGADGKLLSVAKNY